MLPLHWAIERISESKNEIQIKTTQNDPIVQGILSCVTLLNVSNNFPNGFRYKFQKKYIFGE